MIAAVRKQKILDVVLEKKSATVVELARMFNVTNETIRRDLTDLEKQGKLKTIDGTQGIRETEKLAVQALGL